MSWQHSSLFCFPVAKNKGFSQPYFQYAFNIYIQAGFDKTGFLDKLQWALCSAPLPTVSQLSADISSHCYHQHWHKKRGLILLTVTLLKASQLEKANLTYISLLTSKNLKVQGNVRENLSFLHVLLVNVVQVWPNIYTSLPLHASMLDSLLIGS